MARSIALLGIVGSPMTTQRSDDALVADLRHNHHISHDQGCDEINEIAREAADRIAILRARVDLLEGVREETKKAQQGVEWLMTMVDEGNLPDAWQQVRDVVRPQWLKVLAALDAATRAADTDGGRGSGLHRASPDGAPGDAGANLTGERSAE